jgi:hypothetical protein
MPEAIHLLEQAIERDLHYGPALCLGCILLFQALP